LSTFGMHYIATSTTILIKAKISGLHSSAGSYLSSSGLWPLVWYMDANILTFRTEGGGSIDTTCWTRRPQPRRLHYEFAGQWMQGVWSWWNYSEIGAHEFCSVGLPMLKLLMYSHHH
jgi:hypothetical protein